MDFNIDSHHFHTESWLLFKSVQLSSFSRAVSSQHDLTTHRTTCSGLRVNQFINKNQSHPFGLLRFLAFRILPDSGAASGERGFTLARQFQGHYAWRVSRATGVGRADAWRARNFRAEVACVRFWGMFIFQHSRTPSCCLPRPPPHS